MPPPIPEGCQVSYNWSPKPDRTGTRRFLCKFVDITSYVSQTSRNGGKGPGTLRSTNPNLLPMRGSVPDYLAGYCDKMTGSEWARSGGRREG